MAGMKVLMVVAVVVSLMAIGIMGLWFVGAKTAENGCTVVADARGYSEISQEWSWTPLGTKCTFDNRVSETRLVW